MLVSLEIENFAIIDNLSIEFHQGLNVLTGETGAGKSIIIDAVKILLGGRASGEFIRSGSTQSHISGLFYDLDKKINEILFQIGVEPEKDNHLLLQRQINNNGRNICRINGKQVTLSIYKLLGAKLIDIYGQNEHHSLIGSEQQLQIIDLYGGDIIKEQITKIHSIYDQLMTISKQIKELENHEQEYLQKYDLWQFQLNEIKTADLKTDEEEILRQERTLLSSIEKITEKTQKTYNLLNLSPANSRSLLVEALTEITEAAELDERLMKYQSELESCLYQLEDIIEEIRKYADQLIYDPQRLQEVGDRLNLINLLKRKYGNTIEKINTYGEELSKKIQELGNLDDMLPKLKHQYQSLMEQYNNIDNLLSKERKKAAKQLEERVTVELADVEMKNIDFKVKFIQNSQITKKGTDQVELQLTTNPGEPLKPLIKIASGGELSRIMLALKNILAVVDHIPTLIFDEIDTGIGGRAVQAVAEKLAEIAKTRQVICVTHAPQIAGYAHNHIYLFKEQQNNRVITNVTKLTYEQRVNEISRMLAGDKITHTTIQQAKEIIQK